MADPLSIPTTILPESTFDPVQFAKERRQEVLTEQKERRERYNKAWESVGTPSDWNRNVQQELMNERNQIYDQAAAKSAEGIDLTDISHPKYGKDAMEFSNKLKSLDMKIDQSNALDEYLATLRNTIAKDDKNVIDVEATNKNIATLKSLKSFDEINKFMSEKGDDLLVLKKPEFDMDQHIVNYLKDKGIKGMAVSEETPKGSFLITEQYNQIPPEELKNAFMGMLQDPTFKAKVKEMRANDATDLRGGSDLDYLMERKGNRLVRQQTGLKKEWIKPDKAAKEEKPKIEPASQPETVNIIYKSGGKDKSYTSTGENTYTYNQKETPNLRLGEGAIDANTGEKITEKDFVDFTPISSSEYYVADDRIKGGPNNGWWDKGTILSDSESNITSPYAKKQRFVLGVYTVKRNIGTAAEPKISDVKKTVLVPYDNVKNTLDKVYGIKDGLPVSPEQVKYVLNGEIYSIPKEEVNQFLKENPKAKLSK